MPLGLFSRSLLSSFVLPLFFYSHLVFLRTKSSVSLACICSLHLLLYFLFSKISSIVSILVCVFVSLHSACWLVCMCVQPQGAFVFSGQSYSKLEWRPLSLLFTASLISQQCVCLQEHFSVCMCCCAYEDVWKRDDCGCLNCTEVCQGVLPPYFFEVFQA